MWGHFGFLEREGGMGWGGGGVGWGVVDLEKGGV